MSVLLIPVAAHAATQKQAFTELYGDGLAQERAAPPELWHEGKAVALFWRSDCAPCMRELAALPELAASAPGMRFLVVSLESTAQAQHFVPHVLPDNVTVLAAGGDARKVLAAFGNRKPVLPFSVALHDDGSVCESRYGLTGSERVKKWMASC